MRDGWQGNGMTTNTHGYATALLWFQVFSDSGNLSERACSRAESMFPWWRRKDQPSI